MKPDPEPLLPIRDVVSGLLNHPNRRGLLFFAENIAYLLNVAIADIVSCWDVQRKFDVQTVVDTFARSGNEYAITIDGSEDVFFIKRFRRMEGVQKKRKMLIGLFASEADGRAAAESIGVPDIDILPASNKEILLSILRQGYGKDDISSSARICELQNQLQQKDSELANMTSELEGIRKVVTESRCTGIGKKRPSTPPEQQNEKKHKNLFVTSDDRTILYIYKGLAGAVMISSSQKMIDVADLESNIITDHLSPSQKDDRDEESKRMENAVYETVRINNVDVWVAKRTSAVMTNSLSMWKNKAARIDAVTEFYSKKKSMWDDDSMRTLTLFSMENCAGSDRGTQGIMFATQKMLLNQVLQLGITNEQIAKVTPSATTLANQEYRVSAECLARLADDMNSNGVTGYSLGQDTGHRNKVAHHVKHITYTVYNPDGTPKIKSFTLDSDSCEGTAEAVSTAVGLSLSHFEMFTNAKCISITGDSGGGGQVMAIIKYLLANEALHPLLARFIRCILHAYNKCFERAINVALGPQGLGTNSCAQLVYGCLNMIIAIREEGGLSLLDRYYQIVLKKLKEDPEWKKMASSTILKQCYYDEFMGFVSSAKADEIANLFHNQIRPTSTRWQSMIPGIRLVCNHQVIIYFMAQVIFRDREKGTAKYLVTCAADVLGLMHLRPKAPVNASNSSNADESSSSEGDIDASEGDTSEG